ncbi:hypothetical protein MSAN_00437900 [Mycena sanguinolenta]|uniref:F-box domain-containing protein n=1 Tax=Mycena sanguinolenta TaxID=230812 RepID=A0A8H6ZDW1_9AGAR|nr:hypothetical protein MSAN_00437900 [Mycena sanguinolenta]
MSQSVEELRTRIVQLESEIEVQRKFLKKLEEDKSLVQRQLNATLDPVSRLPVEISSEIFLHSLATSAGGRQDVPTGLLGICIAWRDIALATPALWTTVHIDFPCGNDVAKVLPIWFQRARNFPLFASISLCGRSLNWNHRVFDVLCRYGGQLKQLEILDNDDLAPDDEDRSIDLFKDTTSVSLPLLQMLTIRCQHARRQYPASQIFQLLRGAPNIVEFISDKVWTRGNLDSGSLVLPTLRRLIFGELTTDTDDYILHYLTLPSLEILSLPMSYISGEHLVACIDRSGAPLRDLALGCLFRAIDFFDLHGCLRLIPSLTRFKIWNPLADVVTELFAALADSSSLLPNLHDLTIHIYTGDESHISEISWRTLVRALSTRRMEHLYIVPVEASPPMDVLTSLRELVVDGAKIHVGTEELNFVVA